MRRFLALLPLTLAVLSCANSNVGRPSGENHRSLEEQLSAAEARFRALPRTLESVREALDRVTEALEQAETDHPARFELLCRRAWYAIWLAYHSEAPSEVTRYARLGIQAAGEAVRLRPQRVEGYYYRAIATGLFAEQHQAAGREAMHQIRRDARKAIQLQPEFDYGGPHRLLGALYLRAPGPPAGIGSTRRALQHLQEAWKIAPNYAENQLFLAEAYLKAGETDQARALLERLLSEQGVAGDLIDLETCRKQARALLQQTIR